MPASIWQYVLAMFCCTLALFLIHEFFRKFLKITSALFFAALFTFPLWIYDYSDWFLIAKTLLMIFSIIIINFSRLGDTLKKKHLSFLKGGISFWLIYSVLASNILLALSPDIEVGNYFNAAAGFLLCAAIPLPPKGWRIDTARFKNRDLFVDLPVVWCLIYISWWMNFICGTWPGIFSRAVCLTLVTLIPFAIYGSNELWLSIRAYTLVFYLLTIAFYDYKIPYIDIPFRPERNMLVFWGILNGVIALAYASYWFISGKKKYKNKYSAQTESNSQFNVIRIKYLFLKFKNKLK